MRKAARLSGVDAIALVTALAFTSPAYTAPPSEAASRENDRNAPSEVIVRGDRRSVVRDLVPLATLDVDAITATGASTMGELLRAIQSVTQAADGSPPIFLLNAQRVSGYDEINTLPPEAIEKVEVLPEPAALKFGYPPTRRVVNFVTKRMFRQTELRASAGAATDGGAAAGTANYGLTRLRNNTRLTIAAEYRRTNGLRVSERDVLSDPAYLFDAIGNVTGAAGGEIDPLLSAAAGRVVTVAPLPASAADRSALPAYVAGAGTPRTFELGRLRSLRPDNDAFKANLIYALPIGKSLAGSVSLSAERSVDRSLLGPATALLSVPAGNPFSPFSRDVLLYRYLTEAAPLRQRQTTTTIHAGGTLRGAINGWQWDVTAALDQQNVAGRNERTIDLAGVRAAIAGGGSPFVPFAPALLASRLTERARTQVRTVNSKAVATGSPLRLPAGKTTLTLTAEGERQTADTATRGPDPFDLDLGRTRGELGAAIDLPIADRREHVLSFIGQLSLNASANVRTLSGYGTLHDTTYGTSWSPLQGVQILATAKQSAVAPTVAQLSNPPTRAENAFFFNLGTGQNELTTVITGGNPDLRAERRAVQSLAVNFQPFAKRQLRMSATFEATRIREQIDTIYALTPLTETILPDLFVRDAGGRLTSVSIRPINTYRKRYKTLNLQLNSSGPVGAAPPPPKAGAPTQPIQRPFYYAGIGAYFTLQEKLQLRPGTPVLDLLNRDTVSGGGRPATVIYTYGGLNHRGMGMTFDAQWIGASRVRSDAASADLRFSALPRMNLGGYVTLDKFLPRTAWARKLRVSLDVGSVFNSRQRVRDRNGRVPNRYQPELIDPVGRTVKLTLRKLF